MAPLKKKGSLWFLFRAPVYLYRWHLGWLLGHRFLLLIHLGRRTGLRRETVLEILEYREHASEAVVMSGFGRDSDWLRNIEAHPQEEIVVDSRHFIASHRFLAEDEAARVMQEYEQRSRWIAPVIRRVLSSLLGWQYKGTDSDRHRLVRQLPLIAFRPRASVRTSTVRRACPGGKPKRFTSVLWTNGRTNWRFRHPQFEGSKLVTRNLKLLLTYRPSGTHH